ncbi:helix-turn-helix domain-containing protein [Bradyrhizobium sp. UFLA05-112]
MILTFCHLYFDKTSWKLQVMKPEQFNQYLLRLGLSPSETAQLLSVSPRTVRRWQDGEEIPGPAQQAIRAWVRLHERHLPWRPDSVSIAGDDQDQITRHRSHTINLDAVLERVEARGGAKAPWTVDCDSCRASLETMEVSFYKLQSGSFSLGTYRRTDSAPDTERDRMMIEDAVYCIAKALEKKSPNYGPVLLVVHDGPSKGRVAKQQLLEFQTASAAVEQACKDLGTPGYYEPFIMTKDGDLLWDQRELQRECVRRAKGPQSLAALAKYVRAHAHLFVQDGPRSFGPAERKRREDHIKAIADEIDELAKRAGNGSVQYQQFEEALGALHAADFFPHGQLVSDVAFALEGMTQ